MRQRATKERRGSPWARVCSLKASNTPGRASGEWYAGVGPHEECMRTSAHANECYVVTWTLFEMNLLFSQRINTEF
jgi:hypothetical protein